MTTAIGSYATASALKARINISDAVDDNVLSAICDQINQYVETYTGRVLAPITSATYKLDGDGTRVLQYRRGIRAVSLLEVAPHTGAPYETVPASDYFLRPGPAEILPGWPCTRIEFTDVPSGTYAAFPAGYDTVRVTMTTGWAAIPDDVTEVALTAATRAWHAVESGQTDLVGTDDMGRPLVSRFFSARDLGTLRTYSVSLP